jgi:hypothetical protein
LWCAIAAPLSAATLIVGGPTENGNFERTGEWTWPAGSGGTYITAPAAAFEGSRFAEASTLSQRFSVAPENGLTFTLSFYARAAAVPLEEIVVSLASPYTSKIPELSYGEKPQPSDQWQRYTATFVFSEPWRNQESTWNLGFSFLQNGAATRGQIDAVTLLQVPEPSASAALLLGALALATFRRPNTSRQRISSAGSSSSASA